MSSFFLVLYIYAGALARGDSVAIISIPQSSMAECQAAGRQSEQLVSGSTKNLRFVCLKGDK